MSMLAGPSFALRSLCFQQKEQAFQGHAVFIAQFARALILAQFFAKQVAAHMCCLETVAGPQLPWCS